jgi:hypothetical protein
MRRAEQLIQLKPHEEIVTVVREYLITQTIPLAIGGLIYLVVLFFMYPLLQLGLWGVLGFLLLVTITLAYILRRVYLWYYEVFVVTNLRCIDIQRPGLFSREVKELPWSSVTDIVFSQRGLFATLFKYGTVTLVLENHQVVALQHVYQPDQLRDILAEYVQKLQ